MGCYSSTPQPPQMATKNLESIEQEVFEGEDQAPWNNIDFNNFQARISKKSREQISSAELQDIIKTSSMSFKVAAQQGQPFYQFFDDIKIEENYNPKYFYFSVILTYRQLSSQKAENIYDYCFGKSEFITKEDLQKLVTDLITVAAKIVPNIAKQGNRSGYNIDAYRNKTFEGTEYFIDRSTSRIIGTYSQLTRQQFINAFTYSEEFQCFMWAVGIRTLIKNFKQNEVREVAADFFNSAAESLEQARAEGNPVPSALICCMRRLESESRGN